VTTTISNESFSYKGVTGTGTRPRAPLKKAHCISEKTFVVIDDSIVRDLSINDGTWFEQIQTDDGILLKIRPLSFAPRR
jgi:hypothetical protein